MYYILYTRDIPEIKEKCCNFIPPEEILTKLTDIVVHVTICKYSYDSFQQVSTTQPP